MDKVLVIVFPKCRTTPSLAPKISLLMTMTFTMKLSRQLSQSNLFTLNSSMWKATKIDYTKRDLPSQKDSTQMQSHGHCISEGCILHNSKTKPKASPWVPPPNHTWSYHHSLWTCRQPMTHCYDPGLPRLHEGEAPVDTNWLWECQLDSPQICLAMHATLWLTKNTEILTSWLAAITWTQRNQSASRPTALPIMTKWNGDILALPGKPTSTVHPTIPTVTMQT